jgi:hypothetical protein
MDMTDILILYGYTLLWLHIGDGLGYALVLLGHLLLVLQKA